MAIDLISSRRQPIVIVLSFAVLVTTVAVFGYKFKPNKLFMFQYKYQAVFLDNDQIYFGKAVFMGDFLKLTDVFYLKSGQPIQSQRVNNGTIDSGYTLVRLGNELPYSSADLYINREHILFIEELAPDTNVVKAIENYLISKK